MGKPYAFSVLLDRPEEVIQITLPTQIAATSENTDPIAASRLLWER